MSHPNAAYWNDGVHRVPDQTGAALIMAGQDVPILAAGLGLRLPFGAVLDVGCGSGRVARHCESYLGLDISSDAVAYCTKHGVRAEVIDGAEDLARYRREPHGWDFILAMSVFTHVDQPEREAYLAAFRDLSHYAIVDIIPGDGTGDVALWTCEPAALGIAAARSGWWIRAAFDYPSPEAVPHRYYWLEAA